MAGGWEALGALDSISMEIDALGGRAPAGAEASKDGSASAAGGTPTADLLRRVKDTQETSERVMAQNIALLGEVEAMQRQVALLRDEKAALAGRVRALME